MNKHALKLLAIVVAALATFSACGGGGGTSPTPTAPNPNNTTPASVSTTPAATTVAGTISQSPVDAYGPNTIDGNAYASADATQLAPLNGATVIVGPIPVVGATAPATIPAGDVSATTSSTGAFSVSVASAPAAPSSSEPFVVPPLNLSGITPPATGYYVEVYGAGTDGQTAGTAIPLHKFVAASTALALTVSSISSAEAAVLVAVNTDRAANGAGALTFDQSAEDVARLHAADESGPANYQCHYDTHNVGPSSRYLSVGGVGETGEGLAFVGGSTATVGFQVTEAGFLAEKTQTPPGGHYENLVDPAHQWAGLASIQSSTYPGFWNVDYDLITPNAVDTIVGATGYPVTTACPAGTVVNNS